MAIAVQNSQNRTVWLHVSALAAVPLQTHNIGVGRCIQVQFHLNYEEMRNRGLELIITKTLVKYHHEKPLGVVCMNFP